MKNNKILFLAFCLLFPSAAKIYPWIYPEHRDITYLAVTKLSQTYRNKFDKLWTTARIGNENRLSESIIIQDTDISKGKLDFASWPAISGDHSISASEMLNTVLKSDWIMDVADIAIKLKKNLVLGQNHQEKNNALRESDILLQRTDPEYATRAGHNDVHFLPPLKNENVRLDEYLQESIKSGAPLNAMGVYIWYHYSALAKASKLSNELTSEQKTNLILSALADEAFALHFLEDFFAAGHATGTWGNASQKKGTHDYYNEFGIKTSTWKGENIVLSGDAWMREEDSDVTALITQMSLEQLIDAFYGSEYVMLEDKSINPFLPDDFSIKLNDYFPNRNYSSKFFELIRPIILETPIPGLTHGLGELPRFRSELGIFTGFAASINNSLITSGFGKEQNYSGLITGMEVIYKIGLGLDGVLNDGSDGLIFLGVGMRKDGSATSGVVNLPGSEAYGNLLSSIPARSAFGFKFRTPFYLIPGDILIAAPFLIITSPNTLTKMAAIAANGGLIPWQTGFSTSIGRFQFILGREISVNFYGHFRETDVMLQQTVDFTGKKIVALVSYRSTRIEVPILEYRPFRSFSVDQSSKIFAQIYGGVDIPSNVNLIEPKNIPVPKFENIWLLGLRLAFDWRYYF